MSSLWTLAIATFQFLVCIAPHEQPIPTEEWHQEWPVTPITGHMTNLSYHHLVKILEDHGFGVRQFPGEPPLALVGDMAYAPEQVLPELSEGRTTSFKEKLLWKDASGVAQSWYFFDNETTADQKIFEEAVWTWGNTTCIIFNKLPTGPCKQNLSHPSICVGSYDGCWSFVGNINPKTKEPQKMSIDKGCLLSASAHEFGHALGTYHQQSRPDRDDYISVNNENFKIKMTDEGMAKGLSHRWAQGGRCNKDQVLDLPLPFDYMSLMLYSTTAFGTADKLGIFLAKDGHYQYMMDYHRPAGLLQSHYDLYTINTVYGCVKIWSDSCAKNGQQPPKCKNLGYVGKNCKCHCPRSFSGSSCEKKEGPIFPVLAKAKVMLDVRNTTLVDLAGSGMVPEKLDGVTDSFKYYQFITVITAGADPDTQASITIIQTVSQIKPIMGWIKAHIEKDIGYNDCWLVLYWGLSAVGHMRTECLSTLANNEPEGPWFRSRTNQLDLTAHTSLGGSYSDPNVSIQLLEMKMWVVFAQHPGRLLKVVHNNATSGGLVAAAARMAAAAGGPAGLVVGGVLLALVLLTVLLAVLARRRRASEEDEENAASSAGSEDAEEEDEEDETSSSASDGALKEPPGE